MKKTGQVFVIFLLGGLMHCGKESPTPCTTTVSQDVIDAVPKTQLTFDINRITTYLNSKSITPIEDPSGLRYVITTQGTGQMPPCLEKNIIVNYSGKTLASNNTSLSATTFDATTSPASFPLNNLILGWQIGFLKLPKGSSATLYIPSGLGYGPFAQPKIAANSVLVFQVELVDIK